MKSRKPAIPKFYLRKISSALHSAATLSRMSSSESSPSSTVPPVELTPAEIAAKKLKHTQHLQIFITVLIDLIGFGIMIPIIQSFVGGIAGEMGLDVRFHRPLEYAIMGVYSLMQFMFSPVLGRVSDRVGRRPVILASLVGSLLGYLILAAATSKALAPALALSMIFGARIVTGLCGASVSTAQAYLSDITAPEKRTAVMGMIGAAFGMGFVLGPAIGGVTSHYFGMACPFLVAAALTIFNLVQCYRKLPESLPVEKRGLASHQRSSLWATVQHFQGSSFPMILLANFATITAFSMMTTAWIPFLTHQFNLAADQCGYVFTFIGVIGIFIQGGLIRKIAKPGREKYLALGGIVTMVIALLFMSSTSLWASLLIVMALVSAGNSFATPTLNSLASQCGTVQTQGETMGAMSSAGSLGRCCGPVIALLSSYFGNHETEFARAFWISAGIMAAAAMFTAMIKRPQPAAS